MGLTSLPQGALKLFKHGVKPQVVATVFGAAIFMYFLLYLIFSQPLNVHKKSHGNVGDILHRLESRDVGQESRKKISDIDKPRVVPDGEGIWITHRDIHVMSAIFDIHYNQSGRFRVILPSLMKHSSDRSFVCCFSTFAEPNEYQEVPARLEYLDVRFMADSLNGAYECVLKGEELREYDLVSFAPDSCQAKTSMPLKVVYPQKRPWEFAICTKVAYGRLDPQHLLEWFEFMREMGASKVMTFANQIHPDTRRVFDFYQQEGLLEVMHFRPKARSGSYSDYKEENGQSRQARHEKTLTVRECQYRLAGYDFVLTIDFDEMPVPLRPFSTLGFLFQTLAREHPDAGAFSMEPFLMPPDWNRPGKKSSPLFHWNFHQGTRLGFHGQKWVHLPPRTKLAATHDTLPKPGFKLYLIPEKQVHQLHFRPCKTTWFEIDCDSANITITDEFSLARHQGSILRLLRKLPLEDLVADKAFVQRVRAKG